MPGFKERIRCLSRNQLAAAELSLQPSLSAMTKRGLTLLLMLVVSWLVGYLPGSDVLLFSHVTIAVLLKLAIAVAAVVLLLSVYRPLVCGLSHGVRTVFQVPPGDACERSVPGVAWSAAFLVNVCLVYWIFMRTFAPIFVQLCARRWPLTVINLCSLALAIAALAGIVISVSPLFGKAGDSLARHVAPESGDAGDAESVPAKCPQCNVLYETGSRFCSFCGCAIAAQTPPADKPGEA